MDIDDDNRRGEVIGALSRYQSTGDLATARSELAKAIETESQRGLVIILVSYVEDALQERIWRDLPKGKEYRSDLRRGPIRSVEQRITMAQAMGIISDREAHVLDVFKAMRNACAHSRLDISFDTPEMLDALTLVLPGDAAEMLKAAGSKVRTGAFITCVTYLLMLLSGHSHEETYRQIGEFNDRMAAQSETGDEIRTDHVLLEALQQIQIGKQSSGSHPETTDTGPQPQPQPFPK